MKRSKSFVKRKEVKKVVKKKKPFNPQYHLPKCCDAMQFCCAWCRQLFDNLETLEDHVVIEHPYNCNHCLRDIKTWKKFLVHLEECEHAKSNAVNYIENEEKS